MRGGCGRTDNRGKARASKWTVRTQRRGRRPQLTPGPPSGTTWPLAHLTLRKFDQTGTRPTCKQPSPEG